MSACRAVELLESVPCEVRLVTGNHDPAHPCHRGHVSAAERLRDAFSWVGPWARCKHSGREAILCHFPYDGDSGPVDRDVQWRPRDVGIPIIHGHVHSQERLTFSRADTRQVHVGLDAWDMRPVPAETVMHLAFG